MGEGGFTEGGTQRDERPRARKAVVLAAGPGSRLSGSGPLSPKPLVKLLGVSLLERQLRCLAQLSELDEVIVVVGSEGDVVRDRLERSGPWPFALSAVENPDWAQGNGTSLYAAKKWVDGENFYVLMVDHLFEPGTLEKFAAEVGGGLALSVSNGGGHALRLGDATKVRIDDQGLIRAIGKDLADFRAVDMGLFHLDGRIFQSLEQAFQEGEHSLTSGVQRLIAQSPLRAVPSPFTWFDIDTSEDFRHAERHLLRRIPSE